jgi:integrase
MPDADRLPSPTILTFEDLATGYLEDYELHGYRAIASARTRVAHLRRAFGGVPVVDLTSGRIRAYQLDRRRAGAATGTINRETSALRRMFRLAWRAGRLENVPTFPERLLESPPRQGFFEHHEYERVRASLPSAYQDILDFAYYSGWRRREITELTWDEVDDLGGVIRLDPRRSKTRTGRVLPISAPLAAVLARRRARQRTGDPHVFHRDGVTVRAWRRAWPEACRAAGVPQRILHDCRRTAARNLIRAGVPERIAMLLTGHQTRCVFDRYNIVNEAELRSAGQQLVAYLHQRAGTPPGGTA